MNPLANEGKTPSAAAMRAYDAIADALNLDLEREDMIKVALLIDAEYAETLQTLQLVWDDFANRGELNISTVMRMKGVLAYAHEGEDGLANLFEGPLFGTGKQ